MYAFKVYRASETLILSALETWKIFNLPLVYVGNNNDNEPVFHNSLTVYKFNTNFLPMEIL
jgi:hypothetical protein